VVTKAKTDQRSPPRFTASRLIPRSDFVGFLRDIRAGRIKLLAPSSDDLRLLAERGLISVDNDSPNRCS
jgi:hypothetical protein